MSYIEDMGAVVRFILIRSRPWFNRRWLNISISPPVVFLILALAIVGPLLRPGYILTLDSPLVLNWDVKGYFWGTDDGPESVFAATYNSAPIAFVLKLAGSIVAPSVVLKLWIVLLFWLSAVGASRLPHLQGKAHYYAGIFYAVNPFTYVRFVTGQWGLLGAYALTPYAANSFLRMLERPNPREAVKTVGFLTLIGFLQIHGLFLALLVLGALYVGRIVVVPGAFRDSLPMVSLSAVLFLGVNLFWIVRYVIVGGGIVDNMPATELRYFAASPPIDVLSLRGFWISDAFTDISDLVPVWWLLFAVLFFLAAYGALAMLGIRSLRWLAIGLVLTGSAGAVLAAGPAFSITEPAFSALWEHIPWYRAFRDSHKFVALLVLPYVYLGAYGLQRILDVGPQATLSAKRLARPAGALVLIVPIVYALPIFGSWGQLQPTEFPTDWKQVRSMLDDDPGDYSVLVLPWHMYMDFDWLPNQWKQLANPAPNFCSQPTISGDNVEIGPSFSDSSNRVSRYVESLLEDKESIESFGKFIAPLNAKYVVLFKEGEYQSYSFLQEQQDLELVFEGENIALFHNSSPTARAYTVKDSVYLSSLDDYLRGGFDQNPLEHLYILGSSDSEPLLRGSAIGVISAQSPVTQSSPVSYHVKNSDGEYVVLTLPQRTARSAWMYSGEPSSLNLGMMPAFQISSGGGTITFSRFYNVYLPTYALAVASLIAAGFVYRRQR